MILSKREQMQCNHCKHADWNYGISVLSGWYECNKKRDTKFDGECGAFEQYNGLLLRKRWIL